MLCITVFRIPGGVLGAYCPILISRDTLSATRRSAFWVASLCMVATVQVIIAAMLFAGSPELHLLWVCAELLAIFYLISIVRVYESALACGMFLTNSLSVWDLPHSGNFRVTHTLFMLLAILVGCGATVAVEYLFARTHPADAVIGGVRDRLQLAEQAIRALAHQERSSHNVYHQLQRYSARGTLGLRALLQQGIYTIEEEQRLALAIAVSGRMVELTIALLETQPPPDDVGRRRCGVVCEQLKRILSYGLNVSSDDMLPGENAAPETSPLIAEMERTVALLSGVSISIEKKPIKSPLKAAPHTPQRIFVEDAFTNAKHLKFALRGGLSAIVCYFFYMSVGWNGLNASIATCVLTALPLTGAARHKQLMRFSGMVLGACAIGFATQILILPQIDSIAGYALLFTSVVAIGAWIATSTPRIAYCGAQVVLAFEIVNVSKFSINHSLIAARDAVLGIVLGIVAMWLIFDHLWSSSALSALRLLLVETVQDIAKITLPVTLDSDTALRIDQTTEKIVQSFNRMGALAEFSQFEELPRNEVDETLVQHVRQGFPMLRAVLLARTGLLHHCLANGNSDLYGMPLEAVQRSNEVLSKMALRLQDKSTSELCKEGPNVIAVENRSHDIEGYSASERLNRDLTEERLSCALMMLSDQVATLI